MDLLTEYTRKELLNFINETFVICTRDVAYDLPGEGKILVVEGMVKLVEALKNRLNKEGVNE